MFTNPLSVLALGAITFATAQAALVGDAAAVAACQGFAPGSIKCLSDVSFVMCRGGGFEVEQFVAAGTHCEQGIPYQRKDSVNAGGIATATRTFVQNAPASASPPPAASSPPVASPSSASSPAPVSSPAPASTAPSSSASSPASAANTVSPVSGSVTTFATATSA